MIPSYATVKLSSIRESENNNVMVIYGIFIIAFDMILLNMSFTMSFIKLNLPKMYWVTLNRGR